MPERATFELPLASGRRLEGVLDLPDEPGARPTAVICHGFKGFCEWGFFPALAEILASRGFTAVRFNFTGSGMGLGDELVTDLEAFRHATISQDLLEIDDLLTALVEGRVAAGRVDPERIGLIGHSRGGGTSLATASSARWRDRLGALVTWAAISTFDRLDEEENVAWRREGEIRVVNTRTGQILTVASEVLDDIESRGEALDLLRAASRCRAPWLILHGTEDESVPVREAHELEAAGGEGARLLEIRLGSHTFGAQHPFAGPTPHLIEAFNATQRWLREHL